MTNDPKATLAAEEAAYNEAMKFCKHERNRHETFYYEMGALWGMNYRDQHPSRDMVECICEMTKDGLYTIDEMLAELEKKS